MSKIFPLPTFDGTHHISKSGKPAYSARFKEVGKFHEPGLAPVCDKTGWYHITPEGKPAYTQRYVKVWGFYCGRAAALDGNGWMHLDTKGNPVYLERYIWVGNFQENLCVVQLINGFRHITLNGKSVYKQKYSYAGDFKDNVAVVWSNKKQICRHIDINGKKINRKNFNYLNVFHKNFARAQDSKGWLHVKLNGKPAYSKRFDYVEDFYNGVALVKNFDSTLTRINEVGDVVDNFSKNTENQCVKIVITGNIGSGKTTLRKKLKKILKWDDFGIDDARKTFGDKTPSGEALSWAALFKHAQSSQNSILELTGCGPNIHLFNRSLKISNSKIIRLAVHSRISECLRRISKRKWTIPYPFSKVPDRDLIKRIDNELKVEWRKKKYIPVKPKTSVRFILNKFKKI